MKSETERLLRTLFENLFWAGAAGNLLWSFCDIFVALFSSVNPIRFEITVLLKLAVLAVFIVYLAFGWLQLKLEASNQGVVFWIFESLHVLTLVAAAAAADKHPDILERCLFCYFIVTIIGHATGAWQYSKDEAYPRIALIGANLIGLDVILLGYNFPSEIRGPSGFIAAFAVWLFFSRPRMKRTLSKLKEV